MVLKDNILMGEIRFCFSGGAEDSITISQYKFSECGSCKETERMK